MENGNTAGIFVDRQRKWKKIVYRQTVLMAGLFFSILLFFFLNIYKMEHMIETDTQIKVGMLILEYPKLEGNIVKSLLYNKEQLSAKEKEYMRNIGENLINKYGYDGNTNVINKLKFLMIPSGVFLAILFFLAFVLVLHISRKEYEKLYTGIEDTLDCLEQYLKGNYNYVKVKHYYQDSFINDVFEKTKELGNVIACFMKKMDREKEGIKELITDISHQLKTPLASLKMSYEIMDSSEFTEAERMEFLNHGKEEIENLELLLNSLIKVSRLEASMIKIVPQKSRLKKTIIQAVQIVYWKADKKDITIEMDEFEEMEVFFDPKWTQEVFVNILDNGIKYSPKHTSITIRATEMVSYVLIEIEDEGIGIDKKEYPLIFQRFYRGEKKEVKEQEGSGVGLYLSRKILEEEGGTIRVKRGQKNGSIFLITIPKYF